MRKVKVQYRYFDRGAEQQNALPLAEIICGALSVTKEGIQLRERTGLRKMEHDDGLMILNRCDEKANWVFGELASFKPGEHIKVIQDALDQPILNFEQIQTPEGKHPLRGVTYWLVVNDHVLTIQAPNISVNSVKKYLNWLLCEHSLQLSSPLSLGAQISVDDQNAPPIDTIEIKKKRTLFAAADGTGSRAPLIRQEADLSVREGAAIFEILRAAGMGEANLERLRHKAGHDGELFLDMSIKIKRNGKIVALPPADAASLVSEIEEDEIVLKGKHGKQMGKLIMLSYPHARVAELGSLLDPDDALRALIEAFNYFVNNRYIESDTRL